MKSAIIITTYNNPDFLGLCLKSLSEQSRSDFDVYVADDGSSESTKSKINEYQPQFQKRLKHVWHEDIGYRKSAINNLVLRSIQNTYDVLIFVDHDTVAHPRFIEDHLSMHLKYNNLLFMGRRIDLGPSITQTLNESNVLSFRRGMSWKLIRSWWEGETKNILRSIRITHPFLQKILKKRNVADLLGSNFSISSQLLYRINGFNEDLTAYWGEDGDLFIRAKNSGAKIIGLKSYAIQFHLYHKRLEPTAENVQLYIQKLNDPQYIYCKKGIQFDK